LNYVLITPILNESKYLAKLKETILNQTVKPFIWVIGDGNSHDGSYEMARELFKEHAWVQVIRQSTFSGEGYSHQNFSNNINDCYEYAIKFCRENNMDFSYVGKTDATPILSKNYFEALLNEMENDPGLALVCGLEYYKHDSSTDDMKDTGAYEFLKGMNDIKLYRRDFFEALGGYPVDFEPDTILVVKALNRGRKIKKSDKTYFIKPRRGGTKIGYWTGYGLKGRGMYKHHYHPILLLLNAAYQFKRYPYYLGLGLVYGYTISFFRNEEKIKDKEIAEYFLNTRLKEIFKGSLWVCE
jgi:glycosyltransferase involved in cell wall biosynthesis